uniref:Uncharacterized protein n=1 Tax=Maylandia zebra TaxID=106582 RepID=A0A3P9DEG8_9CICH
MSPLSEAIRRSFVTFTKAVSPFLCLFTPASVGLFCLPPPQCSAVCGAITCPVIRGQPCACFSYFVLEKRKIKPKIVCLCI